MQFNVLFRHSTDYVEIKSGEFLFREGDKSDTIYVLMEGTAEISIGGVVFETCGPGAIVGEMAVIDATPRSATVKACTDCKFVAISPERFSFLITETPGFAIEVMRTMADRLKRCDMRVIHSPGQP